MTTVLQVADSVVAQLNAADFDHEFIAERLYVPNFDLEDMKELRVSVVPRDVELLPHDRNHNKYHCRVDVAVQKKFTGGSNEEIDPLVDLIEKIADEFRLKHSTRSKLLVASRPSMPSCTPASIGNNCVSLPVC